MPDRRTTGLTGLAAGFDPDDFQQCPNHAWPMHLPWQYQLSKTRPSHDPSGSDGSFGVEGTRTGCWRSISWGQPPSHTRKPGLPLLRVNLSIHGWFKANAARSMEIKPSLVSSSSKYQPIFGSCSYKARTKNLHPTLQRNACRPYAARLVSHIHTYISPRKFHQYLPNVEYPEAHVDFKLE